MKKESGFGAAGIIIAIAAVVIIGFVGWRVWDSQQQTSSSTSQQTDPNAGYVVIKEWGVRFKPVEGLKGLKAVDRTNQTSKFEEKMFITDDMLKLNPACSGEAEGSRPLGALIRSQGQLEQPGGKQFLKQISNYYFYYYAPASSCSPDQKAESVQATNLQKIKDSINSLEAVK